MTIDEAALRKAFADLRDRVSALENASGLFASDRDLRGQHGDPKVKFSVRDWTGASQVGLPFSQCEPEFLDMLAESLTYSAAHPKAGKERFAPYNLADAKRARSWARRIRAGGRPASTPQAGTPASPAPASFAPPTFTPPSFGSGNDTVEADENFFGDDA